MLARRFQQWSYMINIRQPTFVPMSFQNFFCYRMTSFVILFCCFFHIELTAKKKGNKKLNVTSQATRFSTLKIYCKLPLKCYLPCRWKNFYFLKIFLKRRFWTTVKVKKRTKPKYFQLNPLT